jgi:hypothetical protein
MELNLSDQKMIRDITRVGVRAAILLRGVMLQKVDSETLEWGLKEIAAGKLLDKYFGCLINRPDWVYLLNLLYLVYSLEEQLDFQLREYGLDSVKDDLHEINFSLQQIGDKFQLDQLKETI